jgi:formylglycine-generating enzyme required for sulfatase activity
MHGNVSEWVEDAWHNSYEGAPTDGSPWVKDGGASLRVLRGGSWYDEPTYVRAAERLRSITLYRNNNLGFRLARTLNP